MRFGSERLDVQGLLIGIALPDLPATNFMSARLNKFKLQNVKKDALIFVVVRVGYLCMYLLITTFSS